MRNKQIITILLVFFMLCLLIQEGTAKRRSGTTLRGKVSFLKGTAFIKKGKEWTSLRVNMVLKKEDLIKVDKRSRVKIKLSNGKLLDIKGKKVAKLQTLMVATVKKRSMNSLFKKVTRGKGDSQFGVTGVAGVRGADVSKQNKKVKVEDVNWE